MLFAVILIFIQAGKHTSRRYLYYFMHIYTYIYFEGFSFQINLVSFPLLDSYKRSFQTFFIYVYIHNVHRNLSIYDRKIRGEMLVGISYILCIYDIRIPRYISSRSFHIPR